MQVVFDNPTHSSSACIFDDPTKLVLLQAFVSIMKSIMMPIMSDINEGCCDGN